MKRFFIRFVLPLLFLLWLRTAFTTVDTGEYAYITRFGERVAVYDGATDAGLHVKAPWPVDSVARIDRRMQSFDLPAVEALTRDLATNTVDKTLTLDAYISWHVPDAKAADVFICTVGTPDQARRVLAPRINGRLAAIVGTKTLDELVSVLKDPAAIEARAEALRTALLADNFVDKVKEEYGIQVLDIRVRRLGYPEAVRASINERIRSERARKVAEYESEGRAKAAEITSLAEKTARVTEAEARAKKVVLEGTAEAEADKIRNQAHAQDPAFYAFLQKIKAYQTMLADTKDVLLLSGRHELFDLLLSPPKVGK